MSRRDSINTHSLLSEYELGKKLGEGGFSKVRLGKHKITGLEVAVKIITKANVEKQWLDKIVREVHIMKRLDHPHIVKLYEVIETPAILYLVMEYASGGELFDYLVTHGRMRENDARAYFCQILSAVKYCHKNQIAHRDLKAENVLLDKNMNVKIADFGLSNYWRAGEALETFCGSQCYAAPELLLGSQYTGPEVDVWAMGVLLYIMVTGKMPYDTPRRTLKGDYHVPTHVSQECLKSIASMMTLDKDSRPDVKALCCDVWIENTIKKYEFDDIVHLFDAECAELMDDLGYSKVDIQAALDEYTCNSIAATYFILRHRKSIERPAHDKALADLRSSKEIKRTSPTDLSPPPSAKSPLSHVTDSTVSSVSLDSSDVFVPTKGRKRGNTVSFGSGRILGLKKNVVDKSKLTPIGTQSTPSSPPPSPTPSTGSTQSMDVMQINGKQPRRPRNGSVCHPRLVAVMADEGSATPSSDDSENSEEENQTHSSIDITGNGSTNKQRKSFRRLSYGSKDNQSQSGSSSPDGEPVGRASSVRKRRGMSISGKSPYAPGSEPQPADKTGPQPRSLRFTFSMKTTSSKSGMHVLYEIEKSLKKQNIAYQKVETFCINANHEGVEWEMEVCKLPRLSMNGIKFKRMAGNPAIYQQLCTVLIDSMKL